MDSTTTHHLPSQQKRGRAIGSLLATVFLDLIGLGIVIPIFAPLFLDPTTTIVPASMSFETRSLWLGLLLAAYPIAQFFGAPLLGALSDRIGRRKVLLLSVAGTAIGYALTALGIITGNLALLFISRLLDGFTGGNISTAQSAIADLSDEKSKAKNFGLIGVAFGVGFVIGPYIGGKLADPTVVSWFSNATPFWTAAMLAVINVLFLALFFPETSTTRVVAKLSVLTGFRNIARAFQMKKLRTIFLVGFLVIFGFAFFTQFFQVYLIEAFQFTQSRIADLFAYIGLWVVAGQGILARPLAKRYRPSAILRWSIIGLAIALALLLVPKEASMIYWILPFVAMFNGLTQPNSLAIVSNLADRESQGEILGINQSIQSLATAIPPIVSGIVISINRDLPILIAAASTALAWVIFLFFFRSKQEAKQEIFHEVA